MTLVEFILARYEELEQAARAASQGTWVVGRTAHAEGEMYGSHISVLGDRPGQIADMEWSRDGDRVANAEHIALNDPAYVLPDIAAKRRIVNAHARSHHCTELTGSGEQVNGKPWELWGDIFHKFDDPCMTLRLLAEPFASHSDYEQGWRLP